MSLSEKKTGIGKSDLLKPGAMFAIKTNSMESFKRNKTLHTQYYHAC
jgi:hypothetical protein